jgi:hypothetical protein
VRVLSPRVTPTHLAACSAADHRLSAEIASTIGWA